MRDDGRAFFVSEGQSGMEIWTLLQFISVDKKIDLSENEHNEKVF